MSLLFKVAKLFVNDLEEFVEALNLADWDLWEINVSRVAQNLGKEVPSLNIIEEVDLMLFECADSNFSVFVDPL